MYVDSTVTSYQLTHLEIINKIMEKFSNYRKNK